MNIITPKTVLIALAVYCLTSCSIPIGKRIYHDGKIIAVRALDHYEKKALDNIDGYIK